MFAEVAWIRLQGDFASRTPESPLYIEALTHQRLLGGPHTHFILLRIISLGENNAPSAVVALDDAGLSQYPQSNRV